MAIHLSFHRRATGCSEWTIAAVGVTNKKPQGSCKQILQGIREPSVSLLLFRNDKFGLRLLLELHKLAPKGGCLSLQFDQMFCSQWKGDLPKLVKPTCQFRQVLTAHFDADFKIRVKRTAGQIGGCYNGNRHSKNIGLCVQSWSVRKHTDFDTRV